MLINHPSIRHAKSVATRGPFGPRIAERRSRRCFSIKFSLSGAPKKLLLLKILTDAER